MLKHPNQPNILLSVREQRDVQHIFVNKPIHNFLYFMDRPKSIERKTAPRHFWPSLMLHCTFATLRLESFIFWSSHRKIFHVWAFNIKRRLIPEIMFFPLSLIPHNITVSESLFDFFRYKWFFDVLRACRPAATTRLRTDLELISNDCSLTNPVELLNSCFLFLSQFVDQYGLKFFTAFIRYRLLLLIQFQKTDLVYRNNYEIT